MFYSVFDCYPVDWNTIMVYDIYVLPAIDHGFFFKFLFDASLDLIIKGKAKRNRISYHCLEFIRVATNFYVGIQIRYIRIKMSHKMSFVKKAITD